MWRNAKQHRRSRRPGNLTGKFSQAITLKLSPVKNPFDKFRAAIILA
jgi:hypothetical protein